MENKRKICDALLPALQATRNLSALVDLEYIPEQGQVVATIGSEVKHIEVSGCNGTWFISRIMDVLAGLED